MDAKKYLRRCPASMEKCLLMVALSWTSVVRKHVRKLNNEQDISIRKFTKKIQKAALDECRTYLGSLRADNIEDAFIEVKEAEEIRRLRRVLQAARRAARARYRIVATKILTTQIYSIDDNAWSLVPANLLNTRLLHCTNPNRTHRTLCRSKNGCSSSDAFRKFSRGSLG